MSLLSLLPGLLKTFRHTYSNTQLSHWLGKNKPYGILLVTQNRKSNTSENLPKGTAFRYFWQLCFSIKHTPLSCFIIHPINLHLILPSHCIFKIKLTIAFLNCFSAGISHFINISFTDIICKGSYIHRYCKFNT